MHNNKDYILDVVHWLKESDDFNSLCESKWYNLHINNDLVWTWDLIKIVKYKKFERNERLLIEVTNLI